MGTWAAAQTVAKPFRFTKVSVFTKVSLLWEVLAVWGPPVGSPSG